MTGHSLRIFAVGNLRVEVVQVECPRLVVDDDHADVGVAQDLVRKDLQDVRNQAVRGAPRREDSQGYGLGRVKDKLG